MNRILLLFFAAALAIISSCRDEELNPVPVYETSVHGWGRKDATSPQNFVFQDPTKAITWNFRWNSIDGLNKVTKVEFYYFFDETYKDSEGNDRVARHAGRFLDANGGGKLFKTLQGADLKGNREDVQFTTTQDDIYQAFKDAKFKYDGVNEVPVFNNPARPDRSPSSPVVKGDNIEISWVLYTEDGRKFDFWSRSICSEEFSQSSCTVKFGVVCVSELAGEIDYVHTDLLKGDPLGSGTSAAFPGSFTGTIKWEKEIVDNKPVLGTYLTPDYSFGHFAFVYNDAPALDAAKNGRLKDACNTIFISGKDQYGDEYTYEVISINGPVMVLRWKNTWGDGGTVTLTRKDGANWPPLKGQ